MAGAKVGFAAKIVGWINRSRSFKKRDAAERESRFEGFLRHGQKEGKEELVAAVGLCDDALDIVSDRIALIKRLKALEERIAEIEGYAKLAGKEARELKDLLDRHTALVEECNDVKYQLTRFDKKLMRMEHLGEDAQQDLPEMIFAEERQRIFKQDIGHLEGEKVALEHERDKLNNAVDFVYKLSIVMMVFFGGLMLIMVALHVFRDVQVAWMLFFIMAIAIILGSMIYVLRRRLKHEIDLNFKKQARAIELLNKKNAVYAHFTNYLSHEYGRFDVEDSEMLSSNLTDYEKYKSLVKRLGSLCDITVQIETAIDRFLKDKGIDIKISSIEKFVETLNLNEQKQFYDEMLRDKGLIEKSLIDLDLRCSRIWDTLIKLRDAGDDDAEIMGKLIDSYTEKAQYILDADRAEGTTAMDVIMDSEVFEFAAE